MKKNVKFLLISILIFTTLHSYSQIFYYSEGKKIFLKRDTTTLFINLDKTLSNESFQNDLLKIEGVKSTTYLKDKNVMAMKVSVSNKEKIFAQLKKRGQNISCMGGSSFRQLAFYPYWGNTFKTKSRNSNKLYFKCAQY